MTFTPEMLVGIAAVVNALGAYFGARAAINGKLRALRHHVNAAHKRLDKIKAPPAGMDAVPE